MIKIIHQVYIQGYNAMPDYLQKYCMMWMRMYKYDNSWDYKFWSDKEIKPFIKEHYPDLYDIYIDLMPIKKSDLSRLLILHHYGGLYVDTDTIPIKRIDPLLEKYEAYDAVHSWETESDETWKVGLKEDFLQYNFPLVPMPDTKIIGSAFLYSKPNVDFLIDFVNDAKHRTDQPVLQHYSTWYYTVWLIKNEVETNIKLLEPDYCLSFVPTEKSYMIHLYDFGWKDETSDKPWVVI